MEIAELGVKSLADHLAIADDYRADHRIGAHMAAAALGELQGSAQIRRFLFGADTDHLASLGD